MLKMSFYNGSMDREKLKDFILETDKPILYTHGFKWKGPTTYKIPVTKEKALDIVNNKNLLDADEYEDYLDLNSYSDNDMW